MSESNSLKWKAICSADDILPNTGVGALIGQRQVAVFRTGDDQFYALDNHDPFSGANVLARGILGSVGDKRVVASPIYKQHFCLEDGACIEDDSVSLQVWPVRQRDGVVEVGCSA